MLRRHPLTTLSLLPLLAVFMLVMPWPAFATVEEFIYNVIVGFFGLFVGAGAGVLDYATNSFVLGFGYQYVSGGVGAVVDSTWVLVRDLFNLTFIFGLVYIGLKMILSSDDSQTRKVLVSLILAALLVNFSLFFTKFIVDFSNILATEVVNLGIQQSIIPPPNNAALPISPSKPGISMSTAVMEQMNLQSVFSEGDTANSWGLIFGIAIVLITAAFVFFAGGILLLIRAAALILYMMLSPFMFLGWVFPQLQSVTKDYWKGFLSKAFFAPIYFLMLMLSLLLLKGIVAFNIDFADGLTSANTTTGNAAAQAPIAAIASAFGPFIIIVIFLLASLVIAQKMGDQGAAQALKIGNNMQRSARKQIVRGAGAATFGTAAFAGRNTVGRGAAAAAGHMSRSSLFTGNVLGRQALKATRATADGGFDARNIGGFGKATGLGTGKKGGFSSRAEARTKADEKFYKSIGDKDMTDPKNLAKAEIRAAEIQAEAQHELSAVAEAETKLDTDQLKSTKELSGEMDELEKEIKNMTGVLGKTLGGADVAGMPKAEYQRMVKQKQQDLEQKKAVREAAKLKERAQQERVNAEKKNDPTTKRQAEEYAQKLEQQAEESIRARKIVNKERKDTAEKFAGDEDAHKKNRKNIAEAEIKFANKIAYLNDKQRDVNQADLPGVTNKARQDSLDNLKKKFGGTAAEMGTKAATVKKRKEEKEAEKAVDKEHGLEDEAKPEKAEKDEK
ncbi:MAG: hypothetical protein AAB388_03400 [Patescibacteria group bacterium]